MLQMLGFQPLRFASGMLRFAAPLSVPAAVALLCLFMAPSAFPDDFDYVPELPPLWTWEGANPARDESMRVRFIGPLGECKDGSGGRLELSAFRPLWSRELNSGNWAMDFIWPLSVWRDAAYGKFQWVLLYYGADDKGKLSYRHYVIPIWFCGADQEGKFYWGLFPLYGDVKELIGYDRMLFVLFPLYWHTEKNGTVGDSYVWPLVNWDSGSRADKMRVLPFYAYNNVYGRYYNESFVWPLVHSTKSLDPKMPGQGWLFWPLLGRNSWRDTESWSFIWPLFMYSQRFPKGFRLHCPWPVFQYGKSMERDGDYMLSVWPIWGQRVKDDENTHFFIFPLGWYLEDRGEDKLTRRLWLLPLYWDKREYDKGGETRRTLYRRFWPFASYYADAESCSVKALDIWPQRNFPVVDRNWSPLWTLFTYDQKGGDWSWDLLWGMLRHREEEGGAKGRFAFAPFYDARWGGAQEDGEEEGRAITVRDYFFGIARTVSAEGSERRWRLFWSLEF